MPVRTTQPVFHIAETAEGIPYIRIEPSATGDRMRMFTGRTGDVAFHLKPHMTMRSAVEVVRFLNAVIVGISEQD